jgi:hypothetical protein
MPSSIWNFENIGRSRRSSATTRWRSSFVSRSVEILADLRRVEADPHQADVRVVLPERQELLDVAVAADLLARHGAVHL